MSARAYGFIAPAEGAREQSNVYATGNEIALHQAISVAIQTATHTGLTTTTVAASAYSAQSIQNQTVLLEGLGYAVSYSGTTITITW